MLPQNDQSNCFPLYANCFLFISNKYIHLVDQKFEIINKERFDYFNVTESSFPQILNIMAASGRLFVRSNKQAVEFIGNDVKPFQVCNSFRLATINDHLLVDYDIQKLSPIYQDLSEQFKKINQCHFIRSWNGLTLLFMKEKSICILNQDYSLETIVNRDYETSRYSTFFQSGLCVVFNDGQYFLIDAVNRATFASPHWCFHHEKQLDNLILCECGLTFTNRILIKPMGKIGLGNYLKQREIYYDEWKSKMFSHPSFPLLQLNLLLQKSNLQQIDKSKLHTERFQLRVEVGELKEKVMKNRENVENLIESCNSKRKQKEQVLNSISYLVSEVQKKLM